MRQRDLVAAYEAAVPVAAVGMAVCILKGVQNPDSNWFNPYQKKLLNQNAELTVTKVAAKLFLELALHSLLPTWVAPLIDLDLIRAAATDD